MGGWALTRPEAHALLDAARRGAEVSRLHISRALRVTGDLGQREPHGCDERRAAAVLLRRPDPFEAQRIAA